MDATADVRGKSIGPVQAEGDALPSLTAADAAFVDALRAALAADPGTASRPGQLRQRVEAALGAEQSTQVRPLVHQVVAAAEENLPGYLTRIMPLTTQSLQRLSGELAKARGWNDATAQRVTQIWAHALGFGGVADSWPQNESVAPDAPAPGLPASGQSAPPANGVTDDLTALPPAQLSVQPSVQLPAQPAARPSALPAALPAADPASWPPLTGRLAQRHAQSSSGEAALGVARGYAGMRLQVYLGIVAVLVVLVVAVLLAFHLLVGALPILLLGLGLRRALAGGVLVATETGVEFTPYSTFGSKPQPKDAFRAPWSEVAVTDGRFSAIRLTGRRVQVTPFHRQFTRACLARVGPADRRGA